MSANIGSKGWAVIDCADAASPCAVDVRTAVRAGARPQVLAAAVGAEGRSDEDTSALRELLGRMGRGLPSLVVLGRSQYSLRVLPEPAVPPREVLASLRWALATESETPLDDAHAAWLRIPLAAEQSAHRPRQVYTVTTPSAALSTRLAAWRSAGLRPKVVDIQETALRNLAGALEREDEGLALVAVDATGVSMVFTHGGHLYLDRHIELPPAALTDAHARRRDYERVAQQLTRSVDIVRRTYPFMPVSRVVLAPAPQAPGFAEFLASNVALRVELLDLARLFDFERVPELARSARLQSRCLVALGASLRTARSPQGPRGQGTAAPSRLPTPSTFDAREPLAA